MRMTDLKAIVKATVLGATVLLLGLGMARAQVSLVAAPTTVTLPDGSVVPMWGYSCVSAVGATCTALNPAAAATGTWSPVVITVPDTVGGTSSDNQSHQLALVSDLRNHDSHLDHDRGTGRRRPGSGHVKLSQRVYLHHRLDMHAEPGSLHSAAGHVARGEHRCDKRASAARAARAVVRHGSG